jgi:cytochrome bd-type quinol oxidase subunit 1
MQFLLVEPRKNKIKKQENIFIRHQLFWDLQGDSHYNATHSESLTRWMITVPTAICYFRFQINSTWWIVKLKALENREPLVYHHFVRFSLEAACGILILCLMNIVKVKIKRSKQLERLCLVINLSFRKSNIFKSSNIISSET